MNKPEQFGKYYILERIAVGGMAEVFKAKVFGVEGFQKTVALKRILPNVAENREFITMFIDEAKIAVQLTHANIAQIYELGDVHGSYFIAMEYVFGRDLRTIFDRARRKHNGCVLTPQQCAYMIARACEGLDYAHRKEDAQGNHLGLVHRDISPQNILISYNGEVKVIDFGVAKAQNKMGQTQAGILKGKFAYMSPEQITTGKIDARSDIFSLGTLLHELLTLERLYLGASDFATLENVRNAEAAPPSSINPHISSQLDEITLRALAKDPEERYQNAGQMQEDLLRYLYSETPVYSQKDLSIFMKEVFYQEIEQERQRIADIDKYFEQAMQQGMLQPVDASSTSSWHRQMGDPSQPNFVSTSQYEPNSQVNVNLNMTGSYQPAPSQTGSFQPSPSHTGSHSGYPNPQELIQGEQLPIDEVLPEELLNDEGNDTVMDDTVDKDELSTKRIVGFALLTAIIISLIFGAFVFYFKSSQKKKPKTNQFGLLKLRFIQPIGKNVSFFVNKKHIPTKKLKFHSSTEVDLPFSIEGTYILELRKKGYQHIKHHFTIELGDEQIFTGIRWKLSQGKITIHTTPSGATVFVGKKQATKKTPGVYTANRGMNEIEIAKTGFYPQKININVKEGKNPTQTIQLKKAPYATLQVQCRNNVLGWVYIDGKYRGKTPFLKKLNPLKEYQLKVVPKTNKKHFVQTKFRFLRQQKSFLFNCLPKK